MAQTKQEQAIERRSERMNARARMWVNVIRTGAMFALILAAVVSLYGNPKKITDKIISSLNHRAATKPTAAPADDAEYGMRPVNNQMLIDEINAEVGASFKAGTSDTFEDWTLAKVEKTLGNILWTNNADAFPLCNFDETKMYERLDLRASWPPCFSDRYDLNECSDSWATATASVMATRLCIADNAETHTKVKLSAQDLLSCNRFGMSCQGGAIDTILVHVRSDGIVKEDCFPYKGDDKEPCSNRCADSEDKIIKVSDICRATSVDRIKYALMSEGPVIGISVLRDDFLVYAGGVYKPRPSSRILVNTNGHPVTHAFKIVGWGIEKEIPYWLIEANFGRSWGLNGFAKVVRGNNEFIHEEMTISPQVMIPVHPKKKRKDGAH